MRYFLIVLFGLLSFFASAQDKVEIERATAEYFLELADKYAITAQQNTEYEGRINTLVEKNLTVQAQSDSFRDDMIRFKKLYENEQADHALTKEELKDAKKQIKREKFQKRLVIVGGVVLIVLVAI